MLLTKHCKPSVREWMLEGHFKFGTLKEYRSSERNVGLLSDLGEGTTQTILKGESDDFSATIGGLRVENCSFSGTDQAIVVDSATDAHVFCCSVGAYDAHRHRRLLEGVDSYKANPDDQAFVVLESQRLELAVALLCVERKMAGFTSRPISYGSRNYTHQLGLGRIDVSRSELSARTERSVFTKPETFNVEEEHRIALVNQAPTGPLTAIYTVKSSPDVIKLFKASIVDVGSSRPL